MIKANISGISTGLKNTEASDVRFVKSDKDEGIHTLHITWDHEPLDHKGVYIKATELGAPDPTKFEEAFLQFFYLRPKSRLNSPWDIKNAQYVYSISMADDERLKPLFPCVKRAIRRYDANLGGFEDSMIGVKNTFENMDMILDSADISQCRNNFKSAILLSAGPSLEQEWATLKEAFDSGRFLFIACDALVKRCLEVDIKPHLIVTTERVPGAEDFLKDIKDLDGMTLVSTLMAYGPAVRNWKGRKAFVVRKDYPAHWYPFKNRKFIWSSPSVAPTALGILGLIGVKNVALVGQDLCLDKEGNSHTPLSGDLKATQLEMERCEKERVKLDGEEVTTNSGEKRGTTNTWNVMKGDLTIVKRQWSLDVVTTSWHGTTLNEIPYKPLKDWIKEVKSNKGSFAIWAENKNRAYELAAFRSKRVQAKKFLNQLEGELEKYTPDQIIELPHYRELCLTSCQRAYVTYLNKRFQRGEDKHEFQTLFRAESLTAIKEVIDILEAV